MYYVLQLLDNTTNAITAREAEDSTDAGDGKDSETSKITEQTTQNGEEIKEMDEDSQDDSKAMEEADDSKAMEEAVEATPCVIEPLVLEEDMRDWDFESWSECSEHLIKHHSVSLFLSTLFPMSVSCTVLHHLSSHLVVVIKGFVIISVF